MCVHVLLEIEFVIHTVYKAHKLIPKCISCQLYRTDSSIFTPIQSFTHSIPKTILAASSSAVNFKTFNVSE